MSYNLKDLEHWDNRICDLTKKHNLDWYPILYETCDYYEMIGNMAYHGMPTHFGNWSYGKSFERLHSQYKYGVSGLPYELIINSDPCIAYLMLENPLYLQILIMAHCVGHSDFFKNNRNFKYTRADTVVSRMRSAKKRIQSYVEDPYIGIEKVEEIIDACYSITYNIPKYPTKIKNLKSKYENYRINNIEKVNKNKLRLKDLPYEQEFDIMGFISEFNDELDDWERDIIEIIRDESYYFMPQIRTKIMNEGWACFWHFKILNELDLPQKYHIPFLKSHNQVVRPHVGGINPYHVGFYMFNKIEERYGLEECFLARDTHNDESFLRHYLTRKDCEELNLFTFSNYDDNYYSIDDVSDEDGWKNIKAALLKQVAGNSIPTIYIDEIDKDNSLILHHEYDGRELELEYAKKVVDQIYCLWKSDVKLLTTVGNIPFEI